MAQAFTVLLVDDDSLVRNAIEGIIAAKGFRVLTAGSAIEAMRILAQERVDVLFTDIVMPDQDGIELARQAMKLHPNLAVMFSTAYFSRAAEGSRLGKLLFKPMRAHEIEAALDEVMGRRTRGPLTSSRLK